VYRPLGKVPEPKSGAKGFKSPILRMSIRELKQIIKDMPDEMDVFIGERKTEFTYGLVNSAVIREINFKEDPDGEVLAREKVLILSEE